MAQKFIAIRGHDVGSRRGKPFLKCAFQLSGKYIMCTDKLLFDAELEHLIVTFNHVHWQRFQPKQLCGKLSGGAHHLYHGKLWKTHYILTGTTKYSKWGEIHLLTMN